MSEYKIWFSEVTGFQPFDWQRQLGSRELCGNRLIRIPTGLGKTEGVLGAWLFSAIHEKRDEWPRRLVWCLPMRVLVEQTAARARAMIDRLPTSVGNDDKPQVHVLMGGEDTDQWYLEPQRPAVLIGTQDMLVSRALNRGYASARARWPMEFGLLNQDCLWVMDEVQLMDVGLVTSVQLQAFRNADESRRLKPCHTWWMSATLQSSWLNTVDFSDQLEPLQDAAIAIPSEDRTGTAWETTKPLNVATISPKDKDTERMNQWSKLILDAHKNADCDKTGRVTLVIVNRVEHAQAIHARLKADVRADPDAPQLELIHSRFRGIERRKWVERFLSREPCEDKSTNLIIVSTQVVEAGVDISASAMVTQLAPWPSLVQRFGRAARYQGTAAVTVVDFQPDEKSAAPYELPDLEAAHEALSQLDDVGLKSLEVFQDELQSNEHADFLSRLYRYEYIHLLTRQEFDELFDTSPDLTGADLDISRFIRSGEERDVYVCWTNLDWENAEKADPPASVRPLRNGLCPVAVYRAKKWLFASGRLKDKCRAWAWSFLESKWQPLKEEICYPGQVLLVDAGFGGYDPQRGFTGDRHKEKDPPINVGDGIENRADADLSDSGQDRDDRSKQSQWKTIATHGKEVAEYVQQLSKTLALDVAVADVLQLAALWHDLGKAHPAFQYNIVIGDDGPPRDDLAKAPNSNWIDYRKSEFSHPERNRDESIAYGRRRGFRHELASVLALFELLARHNRNHDALLGPYRELVENGVLAALSADVEPLEEQAIAECLDGLSARDFNLLVYLIGSHHGKVRGAWEATPHDQKYPYENAKLAGSGLPIRGVRDGDPLPLVELPLPDGQFASFPAVVLHLDPAAVGLSARYGASWTDRVHSLLDQYGPTTLAYFEALLRVADAHGSALETEDERIQLEAIQ